MDWTTLLPLEALGEVTKINANANNEATYNKPTIEANFKHEPDDSYH